MERSSTEQVKMKKIKVGITGQNGFVGYHLLQTLKYQHDEVEIVNFDRSYFNNQAALDSFVAQCDTVVHLAALNRHNDANEIYKTNVSITDNLIQSLERTGAQTHIIFSSSTQEEKDNPYGNSKKKCRESLRDWAQSTQNSFTGMVVPNVFGPFGHPYYNSVVATFCHQVANGESPQIHTDAELNLIYVGELVKEIIKAIQGRNNEPQHQINPTSTIKVSSILELIKFYHKTYHEQGVIPELRSTFEHHLFNTYRCYMPIASYFPRKYTKHSDERGCFVELARLGIGGQMSFSNTVPGIIRGNHFHVRKIERFSVVKGKALIHLRRIGTDEVLDFYLDGKEPSYVDMPIWYTHNIKNTGEEDLITIFWINEPYNPEDADTWFEQV